MNMMILFDLFVLKYETSIHTMVLILDGNSEIGAPVRRNPFYKNFLRHFIRSRAVTNRLIFLRKDLFSFMRAQHVLSYHLMQVPWSIPRQLLFAKSINKHNILCNETWPFFTYSIIFHVINIFDQNSLA